MVCGRGGTLCIWALPLRTAHENKLMLRIIFALLTFAHLSLCFNHLWRLDWS
jgi:hypothetical protein